jgi:hypothetical protein
MIVSVAASLLAGCHLLEPAPEQVIPIEWGDTFALAFRDARHLPGACMVHQRQMIWVSGVRNLPGDRQRE